ncbi:carbohydrate esterase family 16 protein [Auricularia subglabra TFB-10046 SS5]|uniref:Carbohydrate esterase family 16 protein n=1 Tax=Auricularia subglabra (strain TFB-10046 / SS5) TaxID=717982 RepID=J0DAX7_AURST|nr:carbohydrate esterase family 16 protein [Auricularia subglabra TFB-10046 SS5]
MLVPAYLFVASSLLSVTVAGSFSRFTDLVTFGDSFTDTENVSDGGVAWPVYAAGYANVTLHPFARSGATCSRAVTPRTAPPVKESQIPAFQKTLKNTTLSLEQTVFTVWIGTNDVGTQGGLITGDAPRGVTIVNVTECAVNLVSTMYDLGARNFIFMNMIPLELTPLYSSDGHPNRYWRFQRNTTEWSIFMNELVSSGNALSSLLLRTLAPRLPGASIAIFDSHALFADMYVNPGAYLNGTAPLEVKTSVRQCDHELGGGPVGGACPPGAEGSDRDSFLWFDELHPSEQAHRVVAREIAATMQGNSTWATWYS